MRRLCNARLRNNRGWCRQLALRGRLRCRYHGGNSPGPRTEEGKRRASAAGVAGRARWVALMRRAKAAGLVERFPNGRKGGKSDIRSGSTTIARAEAAIGKLAMSRQNVTVFPSSPLPDQLQSKPAVLSQATDEALEMLRAILRLGVDGGNLKQTALVLSAALGIINVQLRVDEGVMKERHDLERQIRVRELLADYEQYCARREGNKPGVPERSVASEEIRHDPETRKP